ncbi:cyclophilin-like fold protein [Angustibacter sp. McL0619]|uniref:cyclophilin-like fold protein n=1 Tax=Angustibacter sp. McL0619 TaxID=3415676 RepID=UPI003CE747D5
MTTIRITVADQVRTAQLADTPTARDLLDQLPLTLSFRDYNGVEKVAALPRPLSTDEAPDGSAPDVNDIAYYAPNGNLVFYYGDVGFWDGIVHLGQFNDDIAFVQPQPDGFDVTIERM